jgi:hypothetical protein
MRTLSRLAPLAMAALAFVVGCKEPSVPSEGGAEPCEPAACGPQMGMPNHLCPDGKTLAGPGACKRNADGACGWEIVECPAGGTTSGGPETGGAVCGSRGSAPCPDSQFCDFPADSECGATDRGGTCKPKPEMCTQAYEPVCGCDGETYPSACAAAQKGVSVSKPGPC